MLSACFGNSLIPVWKLIYLSLVVFWWFHMHVCECQWWLTASLMQSFLSSFKHVFSLSSRACCFSFMTRVWVFTSFITVVGLSGPTTHKTHSDKEKLQDNNRKSSIIWRISCFNTSIARKDDITLNVVWTKSK